MSSNATLSVTAKRMPAKSIKPAPAIRIRRRPIRSAVVVIQSEMAASPISVRLRSNPRSPSFKPNCARYSTSTTDKKP